MSLDTPLKMEPIRFRTLEQFESVLAPIRAPLNPAASQCRDMAIADWVHSVQAAKELLEEFPEELPEVDPFLLAHVLREEDGVRGTLGTER